MDKNIKKLQIGKKNGRRMTTKDGQKDKRKEKWERIGMEER